MVAVGPTPIGLGPALVRFNEPHLFGLVSQRPADLLVRSDGWVDVVHETVIAGNLVGLGVDQRCVRFLGHSL